MIASFLKEQQLNIMLILSGIAAVQSLFVLLSKALSPRRKTALIIMNFGGVLLLVCDRLAYIYRGDVSTIGYYLVRVCNFAVYLVTMMMIIGFNLYLIDLYKNEGKLAKTPVRLKICEYLFIVGVVMLIIGSSTGLYYRIDENNLYQRSPGFFISYLFPLAVVIIQFTVILQYRKLVSKMVYTSLLLFIIIPIIATVLQVFLYGFSITNITFVIMAIVIYIFSLMDMNEQIKKANDNEINILKQGQENMRLLFEQTAEALVSAIDAKDKYTRGHSTRVAEYSKKIAQAYGMSESECNDVYYAALLHDVGKIGISDNIINKEGRLTDEEYAEIKMHPVIGKQILSRISRSSYLSDGATYHHERYDGKGYPEGLKGEEIPLIARIIAVADAYDAMTSKRSYRNQIPQQHVREELVKGLWTQFDPILARIMIHLIDLDSEYDMQEKDDATELTDTKQLTCKEHRQTVSEGIWINKYPVRIHLKNTTDADSNAEDSIPSMILFDSHDSRVHFDEKRAQELHYYEYAEIWMDGKYKSTSTRKIAVDSKYKVANSVNVKELNHKGLDYDIYAVKYDDHVLIKISTTFRESKITIALPDSSRFVYISLTGKNCLIENVNIDRDQEMIGYGYIQRIADKISFINDIEGDIPNVQVDNCRSATSKGILLNKEQNITFRALSLPSAILVWHCPYVIIYSSDDGRYDGINYKEYAVIRMDGESWSENKNSINITTVTKSEEFTDWENWKEKNKSGVDCKVNIIRKGNVVYTTLENSGIIATTTTTITDNPGDLFYAFTGDECAITNIRIS